MYRKENKTMEQLFIAEEPSKFLMGYYNNIAALMNLGVVDFAMKEDSSKVTGKRIDEYYNDPNVSNNKNVGMKKLLGAIAEEYFKQEIERILKVHYYIWKISLNTSLKKIVCLLKRDCGTVFLPDVIILQKLKTGICLMSNGSSLF